MSDKKIIFISSRCTHSKNILIGIQKHPFLIPLFKIINIDTTPYPNYIKSVPSLLINGNVITGDTVFDYFGKLVEEKNDQEKRNDSSNLDSSDGGQCRINEDGELEGWCGNDSSIEFSLITEDNDDFSKKIHKFNSNFDFISNDKTKSLENQVKFMESKDNQLSEKRNLFDSDLEKLQMERNNLMKR